MARTVVAIYDDFQTANAAVRDLVDNGFPRDNISLIANNNSGEYGYTGTASTPATTGTESVADETGTGAGVGAGIGAAIGGIGGLLVGLGALTIPGIGPVIAAGPLAVALSTLTGAGVGAVAGGVTGGLLGALIGLGIPEEEAGYYAEGVRRGGVLVTVQAEDQSTDQVMDILNHHNPVDMNQRVSTWRQQGWKGYDPNAQTQKPPASQTMNQPMGTSVDRPMNEPPGQPVNIPINPDVTQPNQSTRQEQSFNRDQDMDMSGDETQWQSQGMQRTGNYATQFDPEYDVYRTHYNTYLADTGYPYDYYLPAYHYGYDLAGDTRYQNSSWDAIEPNIRQDWERQHPGTWDRFKAAIRNAWQDVTGQ
jgi:hypothetical protein